MAAHCLTDELTGRTGTEEALSTLASASVQSFRQLEQKEISLLVLLAELTPRREYYPQHLQVMQKVKWKGLSPLAQHEQFNVMVQSIIARAKTLKLFYDDPTELPDTIRGAASLLERAAIRNSMLRVDGFGAEAHTTKLDVLYPSRDAPSGPRAAHVVRTVSLVQAWSRNLKICPHLFDKIALWGVPARYPRRE